MEQWKKIEGFENYSVSTYGRVRNDKTDTIYIGRANKRGYFVITLCCNNGKKNIMVHRLVADAFIPNPNNYPCVNHIDENKSNNSASNLEWCTYKYNCNYGTRNARISEKTRSRMIGNNVRGYAIIIDDIKYESIKDACRKTGIPCNPMYKKALEYKGHKIKYLN